MPQGIRFRATFLASTYSIPLALQPKTNESRTTTNSVFKCSRLRAFLHSLITLRYDAKNLLVLILETGECGANDRSLEEEASNARMVYAPLLSFRSRRFVLKQENLVSLLTLVHQ